MTIGKRQSGVGALANTQQKYKLGGLLVGPTGIEPATSAMSRQRSNQLSYGPKEECEIYTSACAGASPNALDNISDKNYCHIQFFTPSSNHKERQWPLKSTLNRLNPCARS